MKLLGSTKSKIDKNKNGENIPHLKITDSRVLYTFVSNKLVGSWLEISPKNHIFSKTFNAEFQRIEVWFTNQNSQPLEVEDRINLTLVIRQKIYYENGIFNRT